jgi:hypothetical protein
MPIMKKAPKFLKKYFWDIDFAKLDVEAHPHYVLGRILEYGDEQAIRWMGKRFSKAEVADILFHYRTLSPKSANFWAVIFHINRKKVLCLQKHYLATRRMHWAY